MFSIYLLYFFPQSANTLRIQRKQFFFPDIRCQNPQQRFFYDETGFLHVNMIDVWGWMILAVGTVLRVVRCLAAALASAH